MSFLKCKLCEGEVFVCGEISRIEPKIKCKKCGFQNGFVPERKEKKIIVEFKPKR